VPHEIRRCSDTGAAYRASRPTRCRVYTRWDYYRQRFERDRGLKIDFVLGSPALASRVTGAFVDRDERDPKVYAGSPSDHAPVVVDLAD
jgi:exodeoxyribonuclease-3